MTRDELLAELATELAEVFQDSGPAVPAALLAAIMGRIQQAGYVLVPIEPTEAMVRAGMSANAEYAQGVTRETYKAMLEAAEA